ncbi:hypothetical protein DYB32_010275 [Aphanomyces invadans]|uniref:Tc1-like transposase DDE domain-containing protein n=1 Tax=Aphanomyces invadans TaxID=157072 RepID=A0A418AFY8_9STRA|nr:hypothetical protein DYB32_010275 [Aphanomyces invadans]
MKKSKGPTADEKQRVLDAHLRGDDWSLVAQHTGMSCGTAWRVVNSGRTTLLPRGGVRTGQKKVTAEIRDALEKYLDENCQYTLRKMKSFIEADFNGTNISVQTISRHILGMLYTRVTVVLPPSKGPNFQVQCAVSAEQGLVCNKLERGSIKMEQNAEFIEDVYQLVKRSDTWRDHFAGKCIVIVLDNAPAHSQTESRVVQHDDMSLLRLGPYSLMLNPIESCFSVFKARV